MTSAQLVNLKGKSVGEVNLSDTVFGVEPNTAVLFEALQRQLANARAGTAKAKTRAEVSGGGRKPWRQKGTGRARAGSIRSPLWAGGGVAFGPQPRDYSKGMPKKVRRLALKSALAARADSMVVVKDFADLKQAKTKQMVEVLEALNIYDKKLLIVLDFACEQCRTVERAARNIDGVKVVHMNELNVKDLLDCEAVLTSERTVLALNDRFSGQGSEAGEQKPAAKSKAVKAAGEPKAKAASAADSEPAKPKAKKDDGAAPEKAAKAKADDAEPKAKPKAKKKSEANE